MTSIALRRVVLVLLPCCTILISHAGEATAATPVKVSAVAHADLSVYVSGPGQTLALENQKIVAPFPGKLLSFSVADGDHVQAQQKIGTLLSADSVAALEGAQSLLKSARTRRDRADARLAVKIANQSAVTRDLLVPKAGIVVTHTGNAGALVAQNDVLASIAAVDSIAFVAEIDQTQLGSIHAGLPASVELAGGAHPLSGKVHAVLSAGMTADLHSPVRIDFAGERTHLALGVAGTGRITTGVHREAQVVPEAAIIRDDVYGTTRIAIVTKNSQIEWTPVKTGITERGRVEILSPQLAVGQSVITEGQVGLPDHSAVQVKP